jgi:hypothetical protein
MLLANFIRYFLSITSHLCSVCRNHIPVPSSFMTYHRLCSKNLKCLVDHCFTFYLFFCLAIVLSVLQFTDSDYTFDIFNLFLCIIHRYWLQLLLDFGICVICHCVWISHYVSVPNEYVSIICTPNEYNMLLFTWN